MTSDDTGKLAVLLAKLAQTQQRIVRDRDHARQIGDSKVREEVELYIAELRRYADALATEIAVLRAAAREEPAHDTVALKPPTETR